MTGERPSRGFLTEPTATDAVGRLYAEDVDEVGYVMNASRVWGHLPEVEHGLFELLATCTEAAGLTYRERAVLVVSAAATLGDSYCALAWGGRLAGVAGPDVAAAVVRGDDTGLTPRERALAGWARAVADDPSGTGPDDLVPLREAGLHDRQLAAVTMFCALRLAFSTVNDALGALPDAGLAATVPVPVREAVTFGRPGGWARPQDGYPQS